MINMYQKHFQMIKELQMLPFWVKLLAKEHHAQLHFWILQFIHSALSIPFPEYAKANYKMFKKANGMTAIFGNLNTVFKELQYVDDLHDDSDMSNQNLPDTMRNVREAPSKGSSNSPYINKAIVTINILDKMMSTSTDLNVIPVPTFAQYLSKKRSVNILVQLLMIENQDLNKVILKFLIKYFKCSITLKHLVENGVVDALVLCLHTRNAKKAVSLLQRIAEFMDDYNSDITLEDELAPEEQEALEI